MSANDGSQPTVLVVEDNPTNQMLIRAVLQRAGYQVETAASAEEAYNWLQARRPRLVLMDVQLPGQDGLSLTKRLRQEVQTADLPIIALTAHAMVEDRKRAAEAGCDGYIAKPINTRTLAQEIQQILDTPAPSSRGATSHG